MSINIFTVHNNNAFLCSLRKGAGDLVLANEVQQVKNYFISKTVQQTISTAFTLQLDNDSLFAYYIHCYYTMHFTSSIFILSIDYNIHPLKVQ